MQHLACRFALTLTLLCLASQATAADKDVEEKYRYVRLGADKPALECTFTLERSGTGTVIQSVTGRGGMHVMSSYDKGDVLLTAAARLTKGGKTIQAAVAVHEGKALVKRAGQDVLELMVPAGVIVTSAPDWTDTFLLCRRYDLKKGGKQEFPGLWIHPEQAAQRLTFTIEKQGSDAITHDGDKLELNRFLIRIRNNSPYAAWADAKGRMIKLMSLPFKEGGTELVLEGYEKSAAKLRPAKE